MDEYIFLLKNSAIFAGVKEDEILTMLHCLNAVKVSKKKDSYILRAGEHTDSMGMLLSGSALIVQEDIWGHRNIMTKINPGDTFAESFAASKTAALKISVIFNLFKIIHFFILSFSLFSLLLMMLSYPNSLKEKCKKD